MPRFKSTTFLLVLFFLALPITLAAGTYTVTTVDDSGPGSLRDAISAASSGTCARPCTIGFAIPPPVPAPGYFTIRPLSPLPVVFFTDSVVIDGSWQTRLTGDTNPAGPEIELDGTSAGYRSGIKVVRTTGFIIRDL